MNLDETSARSERTPARHSISLRAGDGCARRSRRPYPSGRWSKIL